MSPRTFGRQFLRQNGTTPHQSLIHQRLLAAQRILEKTRESLDCTAETVGLRTAATLRLHFSRVLGTSPTAYRKRFSMRAENARQRAALIAASIIRSHKRPMMKCGR